MFWLNIKRIRVDDPSRLINPCLFSNAYEFSIFCGFKKICPTMQVCVALSQTGVGIFCFYALGMAISAVCQTEEERGLVPMGGSAVVLRS